MGPRGVGPTGVIAPAARSATLEQVKNDDLDKTLELLAGAEELSETMQRRIVEYAVSRKNQTLLAAAARREDLPDDLSTLVLGTGNAAVIAERARTMLVAGKTADVRLLLAREKRATVTRGLAAMTDLPEEVYLLLLDTDRLTTLTALAKNEHAPVDVREDAVVRVLSSTESGAVPDNLKATLLQLGGVAAKIISDRTHPKAWQFAIEHCACSSEDRSKAARLLAERLENLTDNELCLDGRAALYHTSPPEVIKDATRLAGTLALRPLNPKDAATLSEAIISTLRRIEARVGKVDSRTIETLRTKAAELTRVRAGKEFRELVAEAGSSDEVAQALRAAGSGYLSNVELLALLESEWFSPAHWHGVHYGWNNLRDVRFAIRNPRAGAIAFLRVRVGWLGNLDELLALCDEPQRVLGELLEIERSWRLGLAAEILTSRYLTEEHIKSMPLGMLGAAGTMKTVNFVAKIVEASTRERDAWEALISIGGEFDGSLKDLLETAAQL